MKRILATILILLIVLLLAACQQTPQKAVVVQKDSDRLIEEAQKTGAASAGNPAASAAGKSLSEQYGIPGSYTYDTQGAKGKLKVHVDAKVTVPQGSAMPIYRARQAKFTQEQVDAFWNALCGDAEMWVYSGQRTKSQLKEQIVNIQKIIADLKNDSHNPQASDQLAMAEQGLAMVQKQLETAPDTLTEQRADGKLAQMTEVHTFGPVPGSQTGPDTGPSRTPETVTYDGVDAYERYDKGLDGRGRTFQALNNTTPTIAYSDYRNPAAGVSYDSADSLPVGQDSDVSAETLANIGLKPSEARQKVQDLLDKSGQGMTVDSVYLLDKGQKDNVDGNDVSVSPATRYAYEIYCVRTVNGLPCSYVRGTSKPDVSNMTAPSWNYEELYFIVNKEGIFEMMWHDPIEVTETVNKDAQLKPFSEIKEIFEKMMKIKYEPQAEQYGGMDFEINRVTLSLHRVIEQNSNESGLLVPAWNFYGKLTLGSPGPDYFSKTGETFMTINAIDGSVIDTQKGY